MFLLSNQSGLSPNMEPETFNLGCTAACGVSMDEYTNQETIILSEMARSKEMWMYYKILMIAGQVKRPATGNL